MGEMANMIDIIRVWDAPLYSHDTSGLIKFGFS